MPTFNETFWTPKALEGRDLAAELAQSLEKIRAARYDADTCRMDYRGLADSPEFTDFTMVTRALSKFDLATLASPEAQKAFWLNLHNALVIHAVVAGGITGKVTEVKDFFEESRYIVGGHSLSLDHIAHGILRGNALKPKATRPQFEASDPRRFLAMIEPDARIHFGLYTASESSPPMRIFRAGDVDSKLESSGVYFVRRFVRAERGGALIAVPKLFSRYDADFGGEERVVRFIAECVNIPALQEKLRANIAATKVKYLDYDATLNKLS